MFAQWASWPWIFIIYMPIGIATLATLAATGLLPAVGRRRGGIDVLGALAVTAGLALAVFAVVRAPETGWGSTQTLLQLTGAAVLLALFLAIQKASGAPLMPLSIWRTPGLGISNLARALRWSPRRARPWPVSRP